MGVLLERTVMSDTTLELLRGSYGAPDVRITTTTTVIRTVSEVRDETRTELSRRHEERGGMLELA